MRKIPLYPFFAAVYPVLAAAAENAHLGVAISDIWFPIAFASFLAAFIFLATGTLYNDTVKRGLTTTIIIGFIFWYGYLYEGFRALGLPSSAVLHEWVFPLGAVLGGLSIALVTRSNELPSRLNGFLNLAFGILLLFPLAGFVSRAAVASVERQETHLAILGDSLDLHPVADPPDIYFVVLDAYTGSESLENIYGFDNSAFVDQLRQRAFVVRGSQPSNYAVTFLSLASMLNWDYIHKLTRLDPSSREQLPVYEYIENNRTVRALKRMGYRFVFFPTSFRMSSNNRFADIQLGQTEGCCDIFITVWLSTTALFPIHIWVNRWSDSGADWLPFTPEAPDNILLKFDRLAELPDLEGPLFVFLHLIMPHEPYQFLADCTVRRPPYWPLEITPREEERVRSAYIDQLKCTNRLVVQTVDRLLSRSERPPIILLQSDHGYGRFDLGQPLGLGESTSDQVRERTDVFAAYHLPGVEPEAVPEGMTAVNLFRLVFNEYFKGELGFVENETYWSVLKVPYDFTRLTPDPHAAPGSTSSSIARPRKED